MAGFLYFRSGFTQNMTPDRVEALGLGYAFIGSIASRVVSNSPAGGAGVVFADASRQGNKTAGYHPDEQTWRKMPAVEGRDELWLGYWNDAKPTPQDLDRGIRSECLRAKLLDGNYWDITSTHFFADDSGEWSCELPAMLELSDDGKMVRGPTVPQYRELEHFTRPLIDAMEGKDVPLSVLYDAAIALLRHRYAVDVPEVVALGLLPFSESAPPDEIANIALLTMRKRDVEQWFEDQKKTSLTQPESGSGSAAGSVD